MALAKQQVTNDKKKTETKQNVTVGGREVSVPAKTESVKATVQANTKQSVGGREINTGINKPTTPKTAGKQPENALKTNSSVIAPRANTKPATIKTPALYSKEMNEQRRARYEERLKEEANTLIAQRTAEREQKIKENPDYVFDLYQFSDSNGNIISGQEYKNRQNAFYDQTANLETSYKLLEDQYYRDGDYAKYEQGFNELVNKANQLQSDADYLNSLKAGYNNTVTNEYDSNKQRMMDLVRLMGEIKKHGGDPNELDRANQEYLALKARNEELQPLYDDVQNLIEADGYEWFKENGDEKSLKEFESYVASTDDSLIRRGLRSAGAKIGTGTVYAVTSLIDFSRDLLGDEAGQLMERVGQSLYENGIIDDDSFNTISDIAKELEQFDFENDNNYSQQLREFRERIERETHSGNLSDLESMGMDAVTGAIENYARYNLLGKVGTFQMAIITFADSYRENIEKGYTKDTAILNSVAKAYITWLSENLSTERYFKILGSTAGSQIDKQFFSLLGQNLISMVPEEGIEEAAEYGLDWAVDWLTHKLQPTDINGNPIETPEFKWGDLYKNALMAMASTTLSATAGAFTGSFNYEQAIPQINSTEEYLQFSEELENLKKMPSEEADLDTKLFLKRFIDQAQKRKIEFEKKSPTAGKIELASDNVVRTNQNLADQMYKSAMFPEAMNMSNEVAKQDDEIMKARDALRTITQSVLTNKNVHMPYTQYLYEINEETRKKVDSISGAINNIKNSKTRLQFDTSAPKGGEVKMAGDGWAIITVNPNSETMIEDIIKHEAIHLVATTDLWNELVERTDKGLGNRKAINLKKLKNAGYAERVLQEELVAYFNQGEFDLDRFLTVVGTKDRSILKRLDNIVTNFINKMGRQTEADQLADKIAKAYMSVMNNPSLTSSTAMANNDVDELRGKNIRDLRTVQDIDRVHKDLAEYDGPDEYLREKGRYDESFARAFDGYFSESARGTISKSAIYDDGYLVLKDGNVAYTGETLENVFKDAKQYANRSQIVALTYMNPRQFIYLTAQGYSWEEEDKLFLDWLAEDTKQWFESLDINKAQDRFQNKHSKGGDGPSYLFITKDKNGNLRVSGHEGRHTQWAFADNGVDLMPVEIRCGKGITIDDLQNARILVQPDIGRGPMYYEDRGTEIGKCIAVNEKNRELIESTFGPKAKADVYLNKDIDIRNADKAYLKAVANGDIETARRMVEEKAQEMGFSDAIPEQTLAYKTRTGASPKRTKKVYKVFTMASDGSPTALFVSGVDKLPQNVWIDAQDTWHFTAKNGKMYVPSTQNPNSDGGKTGASVEIPSNEVREELIKRGFLPEGSKAKKVTALAYRPGWHAGDLPFFPQGGMKREGSNYENIHRYNQVVFECEIDADYDYTQDARKQAKALNKDGSVNLSKADMQEMPAGGFYEYSTNPLTKGGDRGKWFISGSLKINRALTQEECDRILEENGYLPQEWEQGEMDLESLGYTGEQYDTARKTLAPITYDDNGNVIPLSQRFNPGINDVRYNRDISIGSAEQDLEDFLRRDDIVETMDLLNGYAGVVTDKDLGITENQKRTREEVLRENIENVKDSIDEWFQQIMEDNDYTLDDVDWDDVESYFSDPYEAEGGFREDLSYEDFEELSRLAVEYLKEKYGYANNSPIAMANKDVDLNGLQSKMAELKGVEFDDKSTELLNQIDEMIVFGNEVTDNMRGLLEQMLYDSRAYYVEGESEYTPKDVNRWLRQNQLKWASLKGDNRQSLIDFQKEHKNVKFAKNGGKDWDVLATQFEEDFPGSIDPDSLNSAVDFINAVEDYKKALEEASSAHRVDPGDYEEFSKQFDQILDDYIKQNQPKIKPKQMSRQQLESIERNREMFANSVQEWVQNYDVLRQKYDIFSDKAFKNAIADVYVVGQVSDETIAELEQSIIENDVEANLTGGKAKEYIDTFMEDAMKYYILENEYNANKKYRDKIAKTANIINQAQSRLYEEDYDRSEEAKAINDIAKENRLRDLDAISEDVEEIILNAENKKNLFYNRDIKEYHDKIANGNQRTRELLYNLIEQPVRQAQAEELKILTEYKDQIEKLQKETGIKMYSKEDEAVGWIIEGKKQNGEGYELSDLKKDFPKKWKDIMKIVDYYKPIVEKMYNEEIDMAQKIYGDVEYQNQLKTAKLENQLEASKQILFKREQDLKKNPNPKTQAGYSKAKKAFEMVERRYNAQLEKNRHHADTRRQFTPHRENYFHHTDEVHFGANAKAFVDMVKNGPNRINRVPSEIAGMTEYTEPKSTIQSYKWQQGKTNYSTSGFASLKHRMQEHANAMAFDPLVTYLRTVESSFRDLDGDSSMNNYITWFTKYINNLAGKSNDLDRVIRDMTPDDASFIIDTLNQRAQKNAVFGNLSSALVQTGNFPVGVGLLVKNGGKGALQDLVKGSTYYINDLFGGANLRKGSTFLNMRYFDVDLKDARPTAKLDDFGNFMMTALDKVTSEEMWYMFYAQGQRLGKEDVIAYADEMTDRATQSRRPEDMPLSQQSKVIRLLAPFQTEVNNQWQVMKDMARGAVKGENRVNNIAGLIALTITSALMSVGFKKILKRDPLFNPIGAVIEAVSDGEATEDEIVGRIIGETMGAIPGGQYIPALMGLDEEQTKALFGDSDPSRYGVGNIGISAIAKLLTAQTAEDRQKALEEVIFTYGPNGYGKQGLRFYREGQDFGYVPKFVNGEWRMDPIHYTSTGGVAFANDPKDIFDYLSGALGGQYNTKAGQEYVNSNFSKMGVESVKDANGNTIKYSKAVLVRKEMEDLGIYDDVVSQIQSGKMTVQKAGLTDAVVKMTNDEFEQKYNEIMSQAEGIHSAISQKYNWSDEQVQSFQSAVDLEADYNDDGKKVTDSEALKTRKAMEEAGIYEDVLEYLNENNMDYSSVGLGKRVVGYDDEEFAKAYAKKISK